MTTEIKPRIVYQIVRTDKPDDGKDIYVGSISLSLKNRLRGHRAAASVESSLFYRRMSEVGIYNWKILPLVVHICDKKTIQELEKQWITLLNPDLNMFSPVRENNEKNRESAKGHQRNSLKSKRYYCDICEKAFCHGGHLKRHIKSSKHFYTYIYSVD